MVLTRKKLKNLTFSKKYIEKTKYKMYNHNIVRMFIYMWFSIIRRKQRMKKRILACMLSLVVAGSMIGCSSKDEETSKDQIRVGMVTDAGDIDDKSFNQGTWEGVKKAEEELGVEINYLKPAGETEAEYNIEIGNLYDAGYNLVICPGFKFETSIYSMQEKYQDAKFVIIDGSPNDGQGNSLVAENTVSIFFAEHEAGFLSGLAAALQLKEAELGFIGGMEVSSVQRFNWGFQQGITYANENLGTNVSIKEENVVYSGSFTDAALGQQLAAQMYDRGVTAIFQSAAATGNGVITEAKQRAALGENVWVIGVDLDQYEDGIYDEANGKSVILTSAVKKINNASFDMIEAAINDQFPGGKTLVYSVNNNGVGIPEENPNLDSSVVETVNEILEKMKNGEVTVSDEQGDLIR